MSGFHDPEVDRILAAREAALRQLATTLDVPAEVLDTNLNHWGQLEDSAAPVVETAADRILAAAAENRHRLAVNLQTWGPTPDRAQVENPACPCWSGFHDQHRGVCGCPTCEPEEATP